MGGKRDLQNKETPPSAQSLHGFSITPFPKKKTPTPGSSVRDLFGCFIRDPFRGLSLRDLHLG